MELYGNESKSIPQKVIIVIFEFFFIWVAYKILFSTWGITIYSWFAFAPPNPDPFRNTINFIFSCVIFLRLSFMMFFLLRRKIPLEETFSIPSAFALYYIGFALFTINSNTPIQGADYLGIALFVIGCFVNTYSEVQRHIWKRRPENKGKLYTGGLFRYSMHINYFGDVLWVTGYALISRNVWSVTIPIFLFSFFVFYNIPKLDQYLRLKYKNEFEKYSSKTKHFIPFIY